MSIIIIIIFKIAKGHSHYFILIPIELFVNSCWQAFSFSAAQSNQLRCKPAASEWKKVQ